MSDKDKVRSRYPHASAEQGGYAVFEVWDMNRDEQDRLNKKHWPETFGRGLFGLGDTEAKAWSDAVRVIESREGKRLMLAPESLAL